MIVVVFRLMNDVAFLRRRLLVGMIEADENQLAIAERVGELH